MPLLAPVTIASRPCCGGIFCGLHLLMTLLRFCSVATRSGFFQRYLRAHLLLTAKKCNRHGVARLVFIHNLRNVLSTRHLPIINPDDQVAAQVDRCVAEICLLAPSTQSGSLRGTSWQHALD